MSVAQQLRQSDPTQQPGRHIHLIDRTPSSVPLPPPRTLPSGLVVGIDRQEGIKRLLAGGQYDLASESANALAARMGYRWEAEVWENMGWNYCVKNGPATITPEHDGRYHAELCFPPLESAALQIFETDADPRRAFQAAVDRLDTLIVQLSRTRSAIALEPLELSAKEPV